MMSPTLDEEKLHEEERVRLGAALAALARRVPVRLEQPLARDRPPAAREDVRHAESPYTPWTRHSRPLYKF